MIYWLIFYSLASLVLLSSLTYDRRSELTNLYFGIFLLALIAGFRHPTVGADYRSYKELFDKTPSLLELARGISLPDFFFEPGFLFYQVLVASFTSSEIIFFLAVAFTTVLLVGYNASKLTPYPSLALLIYFSYDFFTEGLTAIRFGLATGIGLIFIRYLIEKKQKKAIIPLIIAPTFHTAALILVPIYFLQNLKFKRSYIPLALFAAFLFGAIGVGGTVIQALPDFIPRINSIRAYFNHSHYGEPLGLFSLINIQKAGVCLLVWFFWDKLKSKVPFLDVLAWTLLASTMIRIGLHDMGFIIGRGSMLLGIVEIIVLTYFVLIFRPRFLAASLVILYAGINLYGVMFMRGFEGYQNYMWVF